jgi:hypothetical protein
MARIESAGQGSAVFLSAHEPRQAGCGAAKPMSWFRLQNRVVSRVIPCFYGYDAEA